MRERNIYVTALALLLVWSRKPESCEAIIRPGMQVSRVGRQLLNVVFGDYNPSGKLPVTFYKNLSNYPILETTLWKDALYRFMSDPLFPFGYGLSYTNLFQMVMQKFTADKIQRDGNVTLPIRYQYRKTRRNWDCSDIYPESKWQWGPLKTYKGFKRVYLTAGKTVEDKY